MESTRRLSLTLLLVTPIIAARRLSSEDLGLSGVSAAWGGFSERQSEPVGDLESSAEHSETFDAEVYDDGTYGDFGSWLRRKRALDSPGDDLETAEQVLFRPTFRYKHLVKEREKNHRLREELRRQFSQNSPVPASSSPSVASLPQSTSSGQRKYYNSYPQQNQRVYTPQAPTAQRVYTPQAPTAQRVYTPQAPTAQRVYTPQVPTAQRVYTPQAPTAQRVYTPQAPTAQRVYSPQISPSQRIYSASSPKIVPNYQRIVQSPSQYPRTLLFTQNNQGYRPQRSPYAYLYSQRLN